MPKKLWLVAGTGLLVAINPAHATTYTATFDAAKSNPHDIVGAYQNGGGDLLKVQASYDDVSDVFSFRYDFQAVKNNPLGDGYFKFTRDGQLPDGNRGTWGVPRYTVDAQSGKTQIRDYDGLVNILIDSTSAYDSVTGLGYIEFSHNVSDVRAIFETTHGVRGIKANQWDGGSFTKNFGMWSHVTRNDYFDFDAQTGTIGRSDSKNPYWIAFDPKSGATFEMGSTVAAVPVPASGVLLFAGLSALFGFRKKVAYSVSTLT